MNAGDGAADAARVSALMRAVPEHQAIREIGAAASGDEPFPVGPRREPSA